LRRKTRSAVKNQGEVTERREKKKKTDASDYAASSTKKDQESRTSPLNKKLSANHDGRGEDIALTTKMINWASSAGRTISSAGKME